MFSAVVYSVCLVYKSYSRCVMHLVGDVFFFQAEGGIRDVVRSRGLGDVYKRHRQVRRARRPENPRQRCVTGIAGARPLCALHAEGTVSYTHLTLPTSDLV